MPGWSFLTNHARVLVCIARDPGIRLHELAAILGVTERRAFGIVTDLSDAGYVVKEKDGRRNRYRIQRHLPLRVSVGREPTIGEVLELLLDTGTTESVTQHARAAASDPGLQPVAADASLLLDAQPLPGHRDGDEIEKVADDCGGASADGVEKKREKITRIPSGGGTTQSPDKP